MDNIEFDIAAKSTAPRVTPADIEARIVGAYYFTPSDAFPSISRIPIASEHAQALSLLTICVLVLANGFTVTGESACASPENFDAEIGKKIARANAVAKIWPLEGYLLKQRLHDTPHHAV